MILLFVYGSLRRGYTNRAARRLHERGIWLDEAVIRAKLHWRGVYPAITPGRSRVPGEVFRIPPSLLRALNEYEGPAYSLRRTTARTTSGQSLRVWAYYSV